MGGEGGGKTIMIVLSARVELALQASEACVLSIERREGSDIRLAEVS